MSERMRAAHIATIEARIVEVFASTEAPTRMDLDAWSLLKGLKAERKKVKRLREDNRNLIKAHEEMSDQAQKEVERLKNFRFCKPHQESPNNQGIGTATCALCMIERNAELQQEVERLREENEIFRKGASAVRGNLDVQDRLTRLVGRLKGTWEPPEIWPPGTDYQRGWADCISMVKTAIAETQGRPAIEENGDE